MLHTTCCVFGHRTINETEDLRKKLKSAIEKLITERAVDTFCLAAKAALTICVWSL